MTISYIDHSGFRVEIRNDQLQPKCKNGGTPCGKICLPKGKKCKNQKLGWKDWKDPRVKALNRNVLLGGVALGLIETNRISRIEKVKKAQAEYEASRKGKSTNWDQLGKESAEQVKKVKRL